LNFDIPFVIFESPQQVVVKKEPAGRIIGTFPGLAAAGKYLGLAYITETKAENEGH